MVVCKAVRSSFKGVLALFIFLFAAPRLALLGTGGSTPGGRPALPRLELEARPTMLSAPDGSSVMQTSETGDKKPNNAGAMWLGLQCAPAERAA